VNDERLDRDARLADDADADAYLDNDLDGDLDEAPVPPPRKRRWVPAAVAAVMAAAVVGGVAAGLLLGPRDDTAFEPGASPDASPITTSSDPSTSMPPAITLAPTESPDSSDSSPSTPEAATPTPSDDASAAEGSSPNPDSGSGRAPGSPPGSTSRPAAGRTLDWEFVTEPIEIAGLGATDGVVGPDGKVYTFFWQSAGETPAPVLVYDPDTHATRIVDAGGPTLVTEVIAVTGPDGLIYHFGRLTSSELVVAFDPVAERWITDGMPNVPGETLDAVLGSDGAIYLLIARPNGETHELWSFDVQTGVVLLIGEVPWEASALVAVPDGDLLTVDAEGIGNLDLSTGEWGELVAGEPPDGAPHWATIYHYAAVSAEGTILVPDEGPWWLWEQHAWTTVNDPDVYEEPVVHVDGDWIAVVHVDSPAVMRVARAPSD
jgi:hypothetical protein